MKVTIQTDSGAQVSLIVQSGFKLLVDNEVLLEHGGEDGSAYETVHTLYSTEPRPCCEDTGCCADKGCCDPNYGKCCNSSSLFKTPTGAKANTYLYKEVPNSSFIDTIRWWACDEAIGENALEVLLKDGRVLSYAGVPENLFTAWVMEIDAGGSAGRFYNRMVKFNYELVSECSEEE